MFGFRRKSPAPLVRASANRKAPPASSGKIKTSVSGDAEAPIFTPRHNYDWRRLQNPSTQAYGDAADAGILKLLPMTPRFALDVGCNTGSRGFAIKQEFPECMVWGVEPNAAAAEIARTRLDHVLAEPVDDVRWADVGVKRGDIDTVLLFDVLEHIYDPWATLLTLRNLISERAQLVVSVPNVRNAMLIEDLVNGAWRYRAAGLLDITHIRFFTRDDLLRMFYQTGYKVIGRTITMDANSQQMIERYRDGPFPQTIELGLVSVVVQSKEDLENLCAVQHIHILQPARYEELSADEKHWIDAPHPDTQAYAGGAP